MQFGPFNVDYTPRLLIKDLGFDLNSEITHFWGKNGSGKTTVMNLILENLQKQNLEFSYINQNYRSNWLWWLSVSENLEFAIRQTQHKKLKLIDLPEIQSQLSWLQPLLQEGKNQIQFNLQNQFETVALSGGQLQRVILLREILRKPKFLFLDEAFSALDKKVALEILAWLKALQQKQGFKIVSIAHQKFLLEALEGEILSFELDSNKQLQLHSKTINQI